MKHNKKASGNISRRNFAKTVATSIIAAPIISAQPQKRSTSPFERTQHIPPIEISSGSVFLHIADDRVTDHITSTSGVERRKQVFQGYKKITRVQVLLTDGKSAADYRESALPTSGGKIGIWVKGEIIDDKPNMVLSTAGTGPLQVDIDGANIFGPEPCDCSSHGRTRRKFSEGGAKLLKVRIWKRDGTKHDIITDLGTRHQEIGRILIWAEGSSA
jgi:hypothetical protein